MMRALAAFLIAAAAVAHAAPVEQTIALGGLSVEAWMPDDDGRAHPLIVFSHGFHGCATQSRFLMNAFAAAGYVVLAPNHHDASCGGAGAGAMERATQPFREPQKWNDSSYRDRARDISRLIDAAAADPIFDRRVDFSRIGLAGHSLGGYIVLGLAGAWPSWKLPRVKAVLAMSPYAEPYNLHDRLRNLAAPVMYQGGTRDPGISPSLRKGKGSYAISPAPKYYVEFEGAGHFAWTNLRSTFHESIAAYSVAFMDTYVKGQARGEALTRKRRDVSMLRFEER